MSISIHALLAESDAAGNKAGAESFKFLSTLSLRRATYTVVTCMCTTQHFYPRSPCGERHTDYWTPVFTLQFLSTLSLRRATQSRGSVSMPRYHFYPRSPCGERPVPQQENGQAATISIHALLAESDRAIYIIWVCTNKFLSTLSLRRATVWSPQARARNRDFYPRSPCGERPGDMPMYGTGDYISIHALLAESDNSKMYISAKILEFLSTLSLRRATQAILVKVVLLPISIHALLAESDK